MNAIHWLRQTTPPALQTTFARWQLYELCLLAVGLGCAVALGFKAGIWHPMTREVALACALFVGVIKWGQWQHRSAFCQRLRLFAAYGFTLWFYSSIARITPALGTVIQDQRLLGLDRWLFGETPSALWVGVPWWTELMSGAYLSYLFYLHLILTAWVLGPLEDARRFWHYLFVTYSLGFLGYLLVPAVGPQVAFPQLYSHPIPGLSSGWLSQFNHGIISKGTSVYDVFPSLHLLITSILLDFDRRYRRWRFWMMLPVCLLLFVSTIYLRYHYAVDLLAGALCFGGMYVWFQRWLRQEASKQAATNPSA